MEEKEETNTKDSLLIQISNHILDDFYKANKISEEEISTIKHIFENGYLPLNYRVQKIMKVFTFEYTIIDKTDLSILNLKNKYADLIIELFEIEPKLEIPPILKELKEASFIKMDKLIKYYDEIGFEDIQETASSLIFLNKCFDELMGNYFFNDAPNFKIILFCILDFNSTLASNLFIELHNLTFRHVFHKQLKKSIFNEILLSLRGKYEKECYVIPTLKGFGEYLIKTNSNLRTNNIEYVRDLLADYVVYELETFDNNIEKAKNKKQTLIDITPQQTLSIETTFAHVEESKPIKKQPIAKVMMAFINLIDGRAKIIPKDSLNNEVKFTIISNKIKEKYGYKYEGSTLEKEQYTLEGYSLKVYNLLIEWEYNTEAIKYKNRHNL